MRKTAEERQALVSRLIAEREATGETWRSIAARTGINYATLTGWVWRLRREGESVERGTAGRSGFIELVPTDAAASSDGLELVLRGDRRVRVGSHFDASTLARLVRTLEAC
jgi:transposase-like protein